MGSLWMGHHRGDQGENKLLWGHGMRAVSRMPAGLEPPSPDTDRTIVRPLLGFDKVRSPLLSLERTDHHLSPASSRRAKPPTCPSSSTQPTLSPPIPHATPFATRSPLSKRATSPILTFSRTRQEALSPSSTALSKPTSYPVFPPLLQFLSASILLRRVARLFTLVDFLLVRTQTSQDPSFAS